MRIARSRRDPAVTPDRRLRVLVLSWNYPTVAAPQRGLWVERMCNAAAEQAEVEVIVPTPWVPPFIPWRALHRYRGVPRSERRGAVTIHYPRVPGSFEYLTHGFDARLARGGVARCARARHEARPFDLIHAHFIYPDGVVASAIGRKLGIPVMTSEHAFWSPWLERQPREARQVDAALPGIRLVSCVSAFLESGVRDVLRGRATTTVLPNVVDDAVFVPDGGPRDPDELLFVGLVRGPKRIDVLLRAVALARATRPTVRLRILSANAFHAYGRDRRAMHALIVELGLSDAVTVVDGASPAEVAEAMRRCAFVAVSSTRRETFCSVAAEALACGTPLIITRCGGPEEYVTVEDGELVVADDPVAFAAGIARAFARRDSFDGAAMRERVVARFGRAAWRERALALYAGLASGVERDD